MYGFGIVKIDIGEVTDNRQSFFIAWGKTGAQRLCKGTKKEFRWFKSESSIPLANIKIFGYFQSFLSSANVPHFC